MQIFFLILAAFAFPQGWSARQHHVDILMAYDGLRPQDQKPMVDRFEQRPDFKNNGLRFDDLDLTPLQTPFCLTNFAQEREEIALAAVSPLEHAHSHNDYAHDRPLHDALEQGFCSVEVDIFLIDGKLLVGHDVDQLSPDRTLETLYLEPLSEIVRTNNGYVVGPDAQFTLLIDIKSSGPATYARLSEVLQDYRPMLTEVDDGKLIRRAVSVVISGNRPWSEIINTADRLVGIDGRLKSLDFEMPSHLVPLISDRWTSHFTWMGEGEMPADEFRKLTNIVSKAHAADKRVRFWATPDSTSVWKVLRAAGVDLINADDLRGLATFLQQ